MTKFKYIIDRENKDINQERIYKILLHRWKYTIEEFDSYIELIIDLNSIREVIDLRKELSNELNTEVKETEL